MTIEHKTKTFHNQESVSVNDMNSMISSIHHLSIDSRYSVI